MIDSKKYRGWVTLTVVNNGIFTTTKEYKTWDSFLDVLEDLDLYQVVEIKISVHEEGYKI